MTTDSAFTDEQQASYFHAGVCPFCRSPDVCLFPWGEVDAFTESRDIICHDCKAEWAEVSNAVGDRFLEKHKLNTYEVGAKVTVTHRLQVRIRARTEAEAVGKAELLEFDKIVKDDQEQLVFVDEQSVESLEEEEQ